MVGKDIMVDEFKELTLKSGKRTVDWPLAATVSRKEASHDGKEEHGQVNSLPQQKTHAEVFEEGNQPAIGFLSACTCESLMCAIHSGKYVPL